MLCLALDVLLGSVAVMSDEFPRNFPSTLLRVMLLLPCFRLHDLAGVASLLAFTSGLASPALPRGV